MRPIKEKWEIFDSMVSAPILCYILLFLLSFIFIGITIHVPDRIIFDISEVNLSASSISGIVKISRENAWENLIANLGYGIFCSTLVAALVDYGATRRKRENDEKEFVAHTKNLKKSISTLLTIRTTYEQLHKEEVSNISYLEWIKANILKCVLNNVADEPLLSTVISVLSAILPFANDVRIKSAVLANNHYMADNFLVDLDVLIHYIELYNNANNNVVMLGFTIDNILNKIVNLFPEYKSAFYEEWNSSEMIERYGHRLPDWLLSQIQRE